MKTINVFKYAGFGILGIGFIIGVLFAVQALWNWLIPELFNGPVLTFWQTAGLFILSKILLTGIAPGPHQSHKEKKDWKKRFHEKWRPEPGTDENVVTPEQA
jgi:hypothetical protein